MELTSTILGFDSSKFGYCDVSGSVITAFTINVSDEENYPAEKITHNIDSQTLSYNVVKNIATSQIASYKYINNWYTMTYQLSAKFTDNKFMVMCYISNIPYNTTAIKITSCNITAKFHN